MKVRIRYFAVIREKLGHDEELFAIADGSTVGALRDEMAVRYPQIAAILPRVVFSVNREYAKKDVEMKDGDEVALIPPIAGGSGVPRRFITAETIDAAAVEREVAAPEMGAVVTFTGIVRNENDGRAVTRLEYEAYAEMAEEKLGAVLDAVRARWPNVRAALRHRVGELAVSDAAVVIAVAAPHRGEAFDACEFAIDALKETVPIWKREIGPGGASWVGLKP